MPATYLDENGQVTVTGLPVRWQRVMYLALRRQKLFATQKVLPSVCSTNLSPTSGCTPNPLNIKYKPRISDSFCLPVLQLFDAPMLCEFCETGVIKFSYINF